MDPRGALNRAYAHWLKDGLFEIAMGILLAGVGALRAIIHFAGEKSTAYYLLVAGLLIFMLISGLGGAYIINLLKARITYPRTGYMAFRPYPYRIKNILVLLILGGILGGVLGILSTQPNERQIGVFVPIGQGIVGAMISTYAAQRVGLKRLYYLAALSIGIGMLIGVLGVGVVLGVSYFYLCLGIALIVTGCIALLQYLHSHAPVDLNGASQ